MADTPYPTPVRMAQSMPWLSSRCSTRNCGSLPLLPPAGGFASERTTPTGDGHSVPGSPSAQFFIASRQYGDRYFESVPGGGALWTSVSITRGLFRPMGDRLISDL